MLDQEGYEFIAVHQRDGRGIQAVASEVVTIRARSWTSVAMLGSSARCSDTR